MQQDNVLNKIGMVLRELNEQYEFLNRSRESINDIELELFAANAKYLIEFIEFSRKIHASQPPKIEQEVKNIAPVFEPTPIIEEEKIIYTLDIEEEIEEVEELEESKDEVFQFDKSESVVSEEEVTALDVEEKIEEKLENDLEVTEPVIEKEVESVVVVAEPVIEKTPEPIQEVKTENFSMPSATFKSGIDLRNSIGINQKYLFTRALFKNDASAYEDVLTVLNTFQNESRAMGFLRERVISKFEWDMESEEVEAFLLLLKKKFNG